MAEWRSIQCRDVNWYLCGISTRASHSVRLLCIAKPKPAEWYDLTLGEVADLGERAWLNWTSYGIGPKAIEVIKATIDMAAEDKVVTGARDPYVPKCERQAREEDAR